MKNIITNWGGEFGWFLMRYQGIFRAIKYKNPKTKIVMVSRPGMQAIVNDYVDEYIEYEYGSNTDGWRVDEKTPYIDKDLLSYYKNYTYIDPSICMKVSLKNQKFLNYGEINKREKRYDILIHARATSKGNTDIRNWPVENWNELIDRFKQYNIGIIGSKDGALESFKIPKGRNPIVGNFIGNNLGQTLQAICRSKLVIGPSSGPMHLASLCGTPHLVWTDDKFWGSCNGTNRQRYETNWNPLGTKTIILDEDNWQPSVDKVELAIKEFFNEAQV